MAVMGMALAVMIVVAVVGVQGIPDSCFGPLGCFSNGAPWNTMLRPVPAPKSPEFMDTRYYLYTRNAPSRFDVTLSADGTYNVDGSDFDGNRPTIFFIHGLKSSGLDSVSTAIKNALIAKSDANVIVVDWAKGSSDGTYFNAVSNTRVVAATTTQLLKYLMASKGVDVSRVHLVGFSLGAHISGYVGKAVPNIGRITGLDVAQPAFELEPKAVRLDVDDAVFVDVIHTDARPFIPTLGLGFVGAVGDVDFYVNGGWDQPACLPQIPTFNSVIAFGRAAISEIAASFACRHMRVTELYVASIMQPNCRFWGHKVDWFPKTMILATNDWPSITWRAPCSRTSCSEMGFDSIHYPGRGSFDVGTSKTAPFCLPDTKAISVMTPFYV